MYVLEPHFFLRDQTYAITMIKLLFINIIKARFVALLDQEVCLAVYCCLLAVRTLPLRFLEKHQYKSFQVISTENYNVFSALK